MLCVIDADNFFVSCEKLFCPELNGKPAVVLSNNDGCVVARSIESKALGVPMGAPLFKIKDQIAQNKIHVFSGNFALYCDLSDRMMAILRNFSSNVEIYSIDEAFMDLSHIKPSELEQFGKDIRNKIYKEIGIAVSVGIAPTKTLAKIATHIVKNTKKRFAKEYYNKHKKFPYFHQLEAHHPGVCILEEGVPLTNLLYSTGVEEIWGVGRNLADRLHREHIVNCGQLKDASPESIKRLLGINGLKTQKELQCIVCYPVAHIDSVPKSVMNSRSFGRVITKYGELLEAATQYTSELSEKLRSNKITATYLTLFITTKRYDKHTYSKAITCDFAEPTNSSRIMIQAVQRMLVEGFRMGYNYRKAGVIASGIILEGSVPRNIFDEPNDLYNRVLDTAVDSINLRHGKTTIKVTSQGLSPKWRAKTAVRSPRYTTSLFELPRVA